MKIQNLLNRILATILLLAMPGITMASETSTEILDLTNHWVGFVSIGIFIIAYLFVMAEEFTHLRKSKPVILGAGLIWGIIGWFYATNGMTHTVEHAVRHNLLEYAELTV